MERAIRDGLKFLGNDYRFQIIDFGDCIYRDLGDYDIEIYNIKRNTLGQKGYKICVWRKEPFKIVERYEATEDLNELKKTLDGIVDRYARK